MILPDKVNILGNTFDIVLDNIEKKHSLYVFGRMDRSHQKIFIDSMCHREQQESALIHEIIEAIGCFHELGLEHNVICTLGQGIYQALNDNGFLKER